MKKGDRVIVIGENLKHTNEKGTVQEIKGNDVLVLLDHYEYSIGYFIWELSYLPISFKDTPEKDKLMIFDNAGRKYGKTCTNLKDITEEAKSVVKDGQTLYIFKCIGEVNSKIVKTTNSIIY